MKFLRMVLESFRFAWQALRSNVLRTLLSLLGVTVGIFSIIGVLTMVDSLEANVKNALSSIGERTIYVDKFPWLFTDGDYPWWKYFQRPRPKHSEYEYLKSRVRNAEAITIMDYSVANAKYLNSSFDALIHGITYDFNIITEVPVIEGRYFTQAEVDGGRNVAVLGGEVAQTLFGDEDGIGKNIKIKGQRFTVIGIQEVKGKQLVDVGGNPDQKIYIPFLRHKRMFSSGNLFGMIALQAREDDENMVMLESEITGLMRTTRGLRPSEEDNFALNRPDAAASAMSTVFDSLRVGGYIIGAFALLIGGFGIANIMFVSVKERTNIIGIQKSLGAKNYFVLFQFLFESVFLCIIGGLVGLLLVYLISFINLGSLDLILTTGNMVIGLLIASFIGILSGIIPASQAASLNPVIAIRAK
ncbi:ABC transporter permease [Jiulongibacter sediminis]|uniref:ABC transporter n=1 Tax=Jiulongibacter sediminis TaxID=1605367 RepID=A0A0N8HA22_9BACT|nr:ABC transporter permease [Jiulongibacter sediminis]KPM48964.1 ABC transporter [Jiulongibacter sediminis]TBX25490.1 ABC transporter [Jiulongibacter sediminis]